MSCTKVGTCAVWLGLLGCTGEGSKAHGSTLTEPVVEWDAPASSTAPDKDVPDAAADASSTPDADGIDSSQVFGRRDAGLGCIETPRDIDLLFVVDNSRSMAQEQAALARELPRLARALATGDVDGDNTSDFAPAKSLHLGVVSSDMGTAGLDQNGCRGSGDDGRLLSQVAAGCDELTQEEPFLTFVPPEDGQQLAASAEQLGRDFSCIAQLGISGCGMEQPLEAAIKALTPASSELRFTGGSVGHADAANAGFLRDESVLAVILITDEDDCSTPQENALLFAVGVDSPYAATPVNLRCMVHEEDLYPVSRYRDALQALRPEHPELVVFGALVGLPVALEGADTQTILDDPAMQFEAEPSLTDQSATPRPSCRFENPDDPNAPQLAYPPRRIVQLVDEFGERGVVRSLCQNDFSGVLDVIVEEILAAQTLCII